MSKYKNSVATVTSNIDENMQELAQFLDTLNYTAVRATVWTDVEYAIFVEFGTVKMTPRAMIRKSIPDIEKRFGELWIAMPAMFSKADVDKLFTDIIEFARERISQNTPVKSGDLKASWKVTEVEYE